MKPRNSTRTCVVCKGERFSLIVDLVYALEQGNPLAPHVELVFCEECGAVLCLSAAQQADYERYYNKNVGYLRRGNLVGLGGREEVRFLETARLLRRFSIPPEACLADIGCGQGGLVQTLVQEGWQQAWGIDPNQENIAELLKQGYNARQGTLSALPFDDGECDAILACHVIEHLFDLPGALHEVQRVLHADGLFYIEVPDARNYPGIPAAPAADFILEHINHFDSSALINCLGQHGFKPLELGSRKLLHGCGGDTCLYGIFRKTQEKSPIQPDFTLAEHLQKVWNSHQEHCTAIRRQCLASASILVWGLSSYMMQIIAMLHSQHIPIAGLFDGAHYKQQWRIYNMPVQSPEHIVSESTENTLVLVPAGHYAPAMQAFLLEKGFRGSILPV